MMSNHFKEGGIIANYCAGTIHCAAQHGWQHDDYQVNELCRCGRNVLHPYRYTADDSSIWLKYLHVDAVRPSSEKNRRTREIRNDV